MRYEVVVGDQTYAIDVNGGGVKVDGRQVQAALHPIRDGAVHVLDLNGEHRQIALVRHADGWHAQIDGRVWSVTVADERTQRLREAVGSPTGAGGLGETVRAPMSGLVTRTEVVLGQEVEAGTPLLVLEAMKMENEIRASGPGVVSRLLVESGAVVEKGVALVEIGPRVDPDQGAG